MSTKNCATDNEKRKNTVECESLENPLIRIILKVSRLSPSNEIAIRKECNPYSRGQSLTLAAARVVVERRLMCQKGRSGNAFRTLKPVVGRDGRDERSQVHRAYLGQVAARKSVAK